MKCVNSASVYSIVLFFTCCFLCSNKILAQTGSPVLDAPNLAKAIDDLRNTPSATNAQKVLDYVNANSTNPFDSYQQMLTDLPADNYIKKELASLNLTRLRIDSILPSDKSVPDISVTPQGGGISLLDVAGTFIANRFKQEMEIAFLEKFRDWLKGTGKVSVALNTLFPTTAKVLLQNDPYQYTTFLETLKESLNKDVNNLQNNIAVYLGRDPFDLRSKPYYFPALLVYDNLLLITSGQSPVTVLNQLSSDTLMTKINQQSVQSIVQMISLFSHTLTNPAKPTEWLDINTVKNSLSKTRNIELFFGILMLKPAELRSIKIGAKNLYEIVAINNTKLDKIATWVKQVNEKLVALSESFKLISRNISTGNDVTGAQVLSAGNTLANSFNAFAGFPFADFGIDAGTISTTQTTMTEIMATIKLMNDILTDLKDKNYGLALTKVIDLMTVFKSDLKVIDAVKKYGNFAVSVAKSKDKNEMLAALDAAALPVGSYRIKRNSFSNISLNSYAGIAGGFQHFSSTVPSSVKKTNGVVGFTAPVGLAFSWGHRKKVDKDSLSGSSSTLFISVIDLGAVTAFRLTHDSTETLPDLKLKNVLAPGIFYVYGIKKLPISVGAGVQYGPQLRSIKDNAAVILPSAWSARIFVAVDIPFFSFFTRTERKNTSDKEIQ
ncbi:MAG: hypothetical protein ABI480_06095 [Chitinophagaceae bacterium]